jgi:hypothetical protein
MATDNEIEKEIVEKGLTAQRVTPDLIESLIIHEDYHVFPGTMMTVCALTLLNGYSVHGTSACASPENFNEDIGRKIARASAVNEIWGLEGYLLKQHLYDNTGKTVKGRLLEESSDLGGKTYKLMNFVKTEQFQELDPEMKELIARQLLLMREYLEILGKRLNLMDKYQK